VSVLQLKKQGQWQLDEVLPHYLLLFLLQLAQEQPAAQPATTTGCGILLMPSWCCCSIAA
jgi:hypothetical protein